MMPTYTAKQAGALFDVRLDTIVREVSLFPEWILDRTGSAYATDRNCHNFLKASLPPRPNAPPGMGYFAPDVPFHETFEVRASMTNHQILALTLSHFLALQEHECLEFFHVRGRAFISPHRPDPGPWSFRNRQEIRYKEIMRTAKELVGC